jgi:hypothetical protein
MKIFSGELQAGLRKIDLTGYTSGIYLLEYFTNGKYGSIKVYRRD